MMRLTSVATCGAALLTMLAALTSAASSEAQTPPASAVDPARSGGSGGRPPLPLRVPILGVMAGTIDYSAYGLFSVATTDRRLSEDDWLAAGLAAVNLIAATTLITSEGSGPNDAAWVADPSWRGWADAMQKASLDAAIAVREKDRAALLSSANQIAQACQSCHRQFRPDLPIESARQYAERKGGSKQQRQ
jgi:hypothetical protein